VGKITDLVSNVSEKKGQIETELKGLSDSEKQEFYQAMYNALYTYERYARDKRYNDAQVGKMLRRKVDLNNFTL